MSAAAGFSCALRLFATGCCGGCWRQGWPAVPWGTGLQMTSCTSGYFWAVWCCMGRSWWSGWPAGGIMKSGNREGRYETLSEKTICMRNCLFDSGCDLRFGYGSGRSVREAGCQRSAFDSAGRRRSSPLHGQNYTDAPSGRTGPAGGANECLAGLPDSGSRMSGGGNYIGRGTGHGGCRSCWQP